MRREAAILCRESPPPALAGERPFLQKRLDCVVELVYKCKNIVIAHDISQFRNVLLNEFSKRLKWKIVRLLVS